MSRFKKGDIVFVRSEFDSDNHVWVVDKVIEYDTLKSNTSFYFLYKRGSYCNQMLFFEDQLELNQDIIRNKKIDICLRRVI